MDKYRIKGKKRKGDQQNAQSPKKRKNDSTISYSSMTDEAAEERLGISFEDLEVQAIPVQEMLKLAKNGDAVAADTIEQLKEKVYDRIIEYIGFEGYPTGRGDFTEANVNDLVLYILGPILTAFKKETGRNIRLRREKEIIAMDSATAGKEEFIVIDVISISEKKFVLVVESKKSCTGEGMKQCLLAMRDMYDNNGGGSVYGFVTTGPYWRMASYDGRSFTSSEVFHTMFGKMEEDKKRWIKEHAIIVDCMIAALADGGTEEIGGECRGRYEG